MTLSPVLDFFLLGVLFLPPRIHPLLFFPCDTAAAAAAAAATADDTKIVFCLIGILLLLLYNVQFLDKTW